MNSARVVFEIKLENGAQKVVTVKSALVVTNKTDLLLEMKLNVQKGNSLRQFDGFIIACEVFRS